MQDLNLSIQLSIYFKLKMKQFAEEQRRKWELNVKKMND